MTTASGRPVTVKSIHPANVYLARVEVTYYNTATNEFVPFTQTNAQVSFAEDSDGTTPISGLANINMTESPATPGTYYAQVASASLSALVPFVGQTIYQIVKVGATLSDAKVVTPLVVRDPRYAQ